MSYVIESLSLLTEQLAKLPGIGGKTAQRLAYHILTMPKAKAKELAASILTATEHARFCSVCGNLPIRTHAAFVQMPQGMARFYVSCGMLGMLWPWSVGAYFVVNTMCWAARFRPWMALARISCASRSCWRA